MMGQNGIGLDEMLFLQNGIGLDEMPCPVPRE